MDISDKLKELKLKKDSVAFKYIHLGYLITKFAHNSLDYKLTLSLVVPFRKYISGLLSLGGLFYKLSDSLPYLTYRDLNLLTEGTLLRKQNTENSNLNWELHELLSCDENNIKTILYKNKNKKNKSASPVKYILPIESYKNNFVKENSQKIKKTKEKFSNLPFINQILDPEEFNVWQSGMGLNSIILTHKGSLITQEMNENIFHDDGTMNDLILMKNENEVGLKWTLLCNSKVKPDLDEFHQNTIVIYDMERASIEWDMNNSDLFVGNSIVTINLPWDFANIKDNLFQKYSNSEELHVEEILLLLNSLDRHLINYSIFKELK